MSLRLFTVFAIASLLLSPDCRAADPQTAFPNIVYILADDLGYGDVRCFNPESKIATPAIDRLASEGMRFTDAHSGSAVCTPTRYGILTGRYSWRSTLKSGVLNGYSTPLIPSSRLTVASLLKSRGYSTACIGKWHLGLGWAVTNGEQAGSTNIDYSKPITGGPTALGFDYFFGIPASLDMPPYLYVEGDRAVEPPTATVEDSKAPAYYRKGPAAPSFHHDQTLPLLQSKALTWIESQAASSSHPFFLYLPLAAPHTPIMPVSPFTGKSAAGVYGDFVEQVDATVGEIAGLLDKLGLAKNTLLIVASDNGFAPMADLPKLKSLGHNPCGSLRGSKADIYEGGHRIPFIVRWPGRVPSASVCDQTICLVDLMATVAAIVGSTLPPDSAEDSVSLLPLFDGKLASPVREATIHHSANGHFAIRQGPWKLAFCAGSGGWSEPIEEKAAKLGLPRLQLFNLYDDPAESRNVQADHPEIVEKLTGLMEKHIADGRSTPGAPQSNEGQTLLWGDKRQSK